MTNTNKLLADFNRYFTSGNDVDVPERVSVPRDEWRELHAALAQPQAQPTDKQSLTVEQQAAAVTAGDLRERLQQIERQTVAALKGRPTDSLELIDALAYVGKLAKDALATPPAPVLPLSDEQRMQLFTELYAVKADNPSDMFKLLVQAVERAHGITEPGAGGESA